MSDLDTAGLGRRIMALRAERGYSQRELAERAHVSAGYIAQIERGRLRKRPSDEVLWRLAAVLEVPAADLYAALGLPIVPPTQAQLMAQFQRMTDQVAELTRELRDIGARIAEPPAASDPAAR